VPEDRRVDLAWLSARLGVKHLSFASADRLRRTLGVEPGSVTPFGVINDAAGEVKVVIDRAIFERDPIYAHPLVNDSTTAIRGQDLLRFLEATDHAPELVILP
jgi:Ala-tRNA(Pro) deacylase